MLVCAVAQSDACAQLRTEGFTEPYHRVGIAPNEPGVLAKLYVREGDRRVCVASAERTSGLRDTVPLGASLPLTAGSGGAATKA